MFRDAQQTTLARRWVVPSNIPVSAFGGQSLFGAFTQSIGQELSHFPTGPALGDKFWCDASAPPHLHPHIMP